MTGNETDRGGENAQQTLMTTNENKGWMFEMGRGVSNSSWVALSEPLTGVSARVS